MTTRHRARRWAVAGTVAAALATVGCSAPKSPTADPTHTEVVALFSCDRLYEWRDQSYAYATMQSSLCILESDAIRVREFESPRAALAGLIDEHDLLPPNASVAVGEAIYVAASPASMTRILDTFPQLRLINRNDSGMDSPMPRDERDVCVGMIAAHFDAAVDGADRMEDSALSSYRNVYPEAADAAQGSAKAVLVDDVRRQQLDQLRSDDPFAYDVWLSEQVSPLKPLCATHRTP